MPSFDDMVVSSFKDLGGDARTALDWFTETAADEDALQVWRLMCLAALTVNRWERSLAVVERAR